MINTTYIHSGDFMEACSREYEENALEINGIMTDLNIAIYNRNNMRTLGIYDESADDYYEESVGTAITALGQKIIDMIEAVRDKIKDAISNIGKTKRQKMVDDKIKSIMKSDPALGEKLQVKLGKNDININSIKDLNDFYDNVDKLVEQLKKENVDPKSIKGKFQKLKDGLEKNKGTITTVATIITTTIGVGTFVMKLKNTNNTCNNIRQECENTEARAERTFKEFRQCKKNLETNIAKNPEVTTRLSILAEMVNYSTNVASSNVSGRSKLFVKILSSAAKLSERTAGLYDKVSKNDVDARKTKNLTGFRAKLNNDIDNAQEHLKYTRATRPNVALGHFNKPNTP